jgi:hypothetical protein
MSSRNADLPKSQWLNDKIAEKEAITMPDFATKFNYCCEMDAHEAFTALILQSFVSHTSATVLNRYEIWKRDEALGLGFSSSKVIDDTDCW